MGFLGAKPPAVKGLADVEFLDGGEEMTTFDFAMFEMGVLARILRDMREFLIEKFGRDEADKVLSAWDVDHLRDEARRATETELKEETEEDIFMEPKDKQFTEADIEAAKKKAREETAAEFAEKEAQKATEARKKEISDWTKSQVEEGKVPPAMAVGMTEFCESLVGEGSEIEFTETEGGEKKKTTPGEWFKNFIGQLQESPLFTEFATKERAAEAKDTPGVYDPELTRQV